MPVAQTRLETLQVCKLLQCIRDEDRTQLEKLTINGIPYLVNYNEPIGGKTALHEAAVSNNEIMMELLLELGAHPDVVDFKGRTALMRAAEHGHIQCLDILAKHGANMKIVDLEGKGILFHCISPTERHKKCIDLALVHEADVNNISKDGMSVFLKACETACENESICLTLLKHGADSYSKNQKTNETALMLACASGSLTVVREILSRGADVNQVMLKTNSQASHFAAKGAFFDIIITLSGYGANFDQSDDKGNTSIHYAAEKDHAMCCRYLWQRGCNPKVKNMDGSAAKDIAKEKNFKDSLKELKKAEKSFGKIGKNSEPSSIALYDFVCERSDSLLMTFKKYDADGKGFISQEDFTETLQNMGAPIPNDNIFTNIMHVHDKKSNSSIDYNEFLTGKKYVNKQYLLISFTAKKKKKKGGKGKKGKTKIPMQIYTMTPGPRAEDGGPPKQYVLQHLHYTDAVRFNRDMPPNHPLQDDSAWYVYHPNTQYIKLHEAVKYNDKVTIDDVFKANMDIDIKDKYFKTPLMSACISGNLEMSKYLIEKGAAVHSIDNFKWTPLHFACNSGMKDLVECLLNSGAHLEATTVNGATPLMRAIESGRPDLVQFLINKGSKLQAENKKGFNCMDIAAAWGDVRVYEIVKSKWDTLPAPNEKKKMLRSLSKKNIVKTTPSPENNKKGNQKKTDSPDDEKINLLAYERKNSILRAATALAGSMEETEDVTYVPLKTWTEQLTSQDLLDQQALKRKRYGWDVDFPDYKMPLMQNIEKKVAEIPVSDEEDN